MSFVLIELQLLPPVPWFILCGNDFLIDDTEKFQKQTFRNRFSIAGANGIQTLTIPVKKGKTLLAYKEVQIDYSTDWQRSHWQAILSAYNNSPWFLHYKDVLKEAYFTQSDSLFDCNFRLLQLMVKWLKLEKGEVKLLSENKDLTFHNMKNIILPNQESPVISPAYQQVFQEKNGFLSSLSILDLIFNQGPVAKEYLKG